MAIIARTSRSLIALYVLNIYLTCNKLRLFSKISVLQNNAYNKNISMILRISIIASITASHSLMGQGDIA